jgi:hypothetical protein
VGYEDAILEQAAMPRIRAKSLPLVLVGRTVCPNGRSQIEPVSLDGDNTLQLLWAVIETIARYP